MKGLAWLVVGVGLAALLAGGAVAAWLRLPPVEGPMPFLPLAADKSLGVNADLSRYDAAGREQALIAMEAAGFRWLRHRFPWDVIEPQPGVYDWTDWDLLVEDVARHNLKLIAVLDGSPAWARAGEDADNPLAPPVETRDFGEFVAAFAARYGGWIDYYQLWDEPNIAPHWGAREIDPAAYARLLREGAIRLRAADPGAVVLLAALAPNVEAGGANLSDLLFLDALYRQGAEEWFDLVAAQPYSFEDPPDAPADAGRLTWRRVALLRQVMEAHGDVETAVWAVSFGLTGATVEAIAAAVAQARAEWPWTGPMLWAAWSPADPHGQYALVDAGDRPGPAYQALRAQAMAPIVAWPGVYPADHPSGRYEGDWRVTPWGADIGGSGDRLAISFHGTRLDLTVHRGDYRAFLFVAVDGQPANALPRDEQGRAYVVLYDPLLETEAVTLVRGLPDGDHLAEITAERGWGQWAIVGWRVWREAPRPVPWLPITLSLACAIVLALTVWGGRLGIAPGSRRQCLRLPGRPPARTEASTPVDAWSRAPEVRLESLSLMCMRSGLPSLPLLLSSLLTRYRALDDRLALALTAGAAVLLYVMVGTLPTLAALGLLALLLFLRPEMGLPLIAFALPFYQPGRPLLGKLFSMVEILTVLTAVGWVLQEAGGRRQEAGGRRQEAGGRRQEAGGRRQEVTVLDWGVVALVGVGAASLLWAEHLREAAREFRTVVLEGAIFYGLLRVMVRGRRDVWRVTDAWLLGAAGIALVGLCQWLLGENLIAAEGVWRVKGFYGSPNNLALYLGRALPGGIALALWGQDRRRRWFWGLAALLMAAALFLTYSRGAWLVGVPAALLFLAAMRGRRALVMAAGGLLVAALVVVLGMGTGRLTSLLDRSEGTTFFRLQLWRSSLTMIRDHPLLGVGLDNFLYQYRTRYVLPTAWEEFNLSHPHNLVLDFWLRLGLPGLAVLLWLLAAFFRTGFRAYRHLPAGDQRLLVLSLMAGMVNFLAHGLVDNAFFLVDLAFVFVLMVALVCRADEARGMMEEGGERCAS